MPIMTLKSISLLTSAEAEIAELIRKLLKESRFSGRIVYKTQPSTFIDPKWADLPADLREALYTGTILFSIVKGMERSRLVIAVIDRNAPSAELVAQLLRRFQISVLICDTGAGFMPIHRFIKDILESRCALLTSEPLSKR